VHVLLVFLLLNIFYGLENDTNNENSENEQYETSFADNSTLMFESHLTNEAKESNNLFADMDYMIIINLEEID